MTRPPGTQAQRAGDQRRNLEALLYAHSGEVMALKLVIAEAVEVGREDHFILALLENLAVMMELEQHPERLNDIRARITALQAIEERQ